MGGVYNGTRDKYCERYNYWFMCMLFAFAPVACT